MMLTFADPKFKQYGLEALYKLKVILDGANVPFRIDYGTLLGCIRNHDLLATDYDIDIAVLFEDWNNSTVATFKQQGFRSRSEHHCTKDMAKKFFGADKVGLTMVCLEYKGVLIDIGLYRKGAGNFVGKRVLAISSKKKFQVPEALIIQSVEVAFGNITVNVPKDYDAYLTYIYGDWKHPASKHRQFN